jgi:hypothetical protein
VINIRKLAALDIVFHGSRLILVEFAVGVFLPLTLGLVSLVRSHARWQTVVGTYLVLLAFNYVPLAVYAIIMVRKRSAREEVIDEVAHREHIASKYMPQSLLLLVPLLVPLAALAQELRSRK